MVEVPNINMEVTKYFTEFLLQVKSLSENSTCIYTASFLFTAFAIYLAWKLTLTAGSMGGKHKQADISHVAKCDERIIENTKEEDSGSNASEISKEKPTATCHPLKKETIEKKGSAATANSEKDEEPETLEEIENMDPLEYASHIQSRVKKVKNREMWKGVENELSADERQKEREAQREQLEAIFKLMETQKERFGVDSVGDVEEQVRLYM